jgi:hypothetical protein
MSAARLGSGAADRGVIVWSVVHKPSPAGPVDRMILA